MSVIVLCMCCFEMFFYCLVHLVMLDMFSTLEFITMKDPNRPRDTPVSDNSTNFEKKRDICIGFLILSAIVYVLARAGGAGSCDGMVPIDSLSQGASSSAQLTSSSSSYESTRIRELEAQVAELKKTATSSTTSKSSNTNSPAVFDIDTYRENVSTPLFASSPPCQRNNKLDFNIS